MMGIRSHDEAVVSDVDVKVMVGRPMMRMCASLWDARTKGRWDGTPGARIILRFLQSYPPVGVRL